jgi:pyruvate dehydrogenase E2 component (dihydrolipoamide acetyltransferase)
MAVQEVRVPDLGEFSDVEIVEVMVHQGDRVAVEDPLITLETDKAAMEVPSPTEGVVREMKVSAGDRVSKGDLILLLDSAVVAAPESSAPTGGNQADAPLPEAIPSVDTAGPVAVRVPDLGDFAEAEIIEVQAEVGATLELEDPVITLETDKAAMDVPATVAGKILSVAVKLGDKVGEGALILEVEPVAGAAASQMQSPDEDSTETLIKPVLDSRAPSPARPPVEKPRGVPGRLPPINEQTFGRAHASPSVRKFARELGVDLGQVKGNGQKGRVLRDDVAAFVKAVMTGQAAAPGGSALPKLPEVDFTKFGAVEVKPLTRIQKISGPRLHASWVNIPHVTQNDEADITDLETRRKKLKKDAADQGVKLTPLAFIIKAAVIALKQFPVFNTSMSSDGESLVFKKYFHIGFAADTPNGLMVPVIRDADLKDVMSIAKELGELSERARDGKLKATEMQGGTFTVSSLGGIGGTTFTPIINPPEVAILGVGKSAFKPVYQDVDFVPRLILPVSLSYDHRVIDGATGVRFTTYLCSVLADVDRLLLGS